MAAITITDVHKHYGRTAAVRGVDLEIAEGEFIVVLGPSGCGKSTLLRMIAGLEEISAGTIAIDGGVINDLEPGERGCAMVFQNYALYPHMSVADNIGYALKVAGVARARRRAEVERVAAMLELTPLLARKPNQLSGGQRQRVAMGRAMIRSPKVFLFDEPLSNLDAKLRLQMRLEIKRLHGELRTTSVFVTHDQFEAMTLADRLVVMNGGLIEQVGTPGDVYNRPASRFVADFIGTPPMNFLPAIIDPDGVARVGEGWSPCPEARWRLAEGTHVDIGMRPGAIGIAPALPGGRLDIEMVENVGNELHVHARHETGRITICRPPQGALPTGPFSILCPAGEAHAFVADTGRRAEQDAPATTSNPTKGDRQWQDIPALSI